ncbi:MAG: DUF3833 domain-containing protein [Betaproteobacteria bacterium]|nr:DUF3833 domain-containing protein [Betaproteobacteria bacterium]
MKATLLAAFAAAFTLAGCTTVSPSEYRAARPVLDLTQYFDGTVDGWGMVQDRSGKVLRRFHVVIAAQWTGDVGTLDETFDWSDGKREKRVWTITRRDATRYTGTAADVVGTAEGEAQGNALQWRYVLRLPEEQGGWLVDLDDWMYMVDEATVLNRSVITKFGIRFGDITIAFRKRG